MRSKYGLNNLIREIIGSKSINFVSIVAAQFQTERKIYRQGKTVQT